MNELKELLINVPDSYYDFVVSMLSEVRKSAYRREGLLDYLRKHEDATSSEVIRYLIEDLGLYEEFKSKEKKEVVAV